MKSRLIPELFGRPARVDKTPWSDMLVSYLPVLLALLLWGVSLRGVDLDHMSGLGLITAFPISYYMALLLLTVGFVYAVYRRTIVEGHLVVYAIVLILMIHGTPQLLYGTLRYSWAWKHAGIIDYILRHLQVDPAIPVLDVYHNWPGFFALGSLFTDALGFTSAITFAGWAPVFFNLLNLGAVIMLFKTFTQDRRLVWLGVWIFFLTNWVGQDYFSPQALTYFFYLIVLAVCLTWFKMREIPSRERIKRWVVFDKAARTFHNLLKHAERKDLAEYPQLSLQHVGLITIVILILVVIAASHQLTPFMVISALSALIVFQIVRSRSLPILMIILTLSWALFVAGTYFQDVIPSVLKYIGLLFGNVSDSLVTISDVSRGQQIVSYSSRLISLFVWIMAGIGFVRRYRSGHLDLPALLLAGAPFVLLVASSYGGEILFRVYLFSLAPMTFFAASAIHPQPRLVSTWRIPVVTILIYVFTLIPFSLAYFGKEQQYYYTKDEVAASQYLYSTAPPNSLLVEGSRNYPSQYLNYENFTYVPIDREPLESRMNVIEQPVEVLSRWLDNDRYSATYLIITRSQKIAAEALGTLPPGSLDNLEQALRESSNFDILFSNQDATIYILSGGTP